MKIMSYNIRGAGSTIKCKEVRELIKKHGIDICCLQETKLESISDAHAKLLWGMGNFGWVTRDFDWQVWRIDYIMEF